VAADFVARVRRMQAEGFILARLEEDGTVCAVAGYRFHEKLFSGRTLYVDDLVSDHTRRSRGHGAQLLAWLAAQARARDCDLLELDSGVQRFDAHRFYFRERMKISSYHFTLPLKG
jgi:GNAT superfamily N-acetyltransferase